MRPTVLVSTLGVKLNTDFRSVNFGVKTLKVSGTAIRLCIIHTKMLVHFRLNLEL